MITTKLNEEVKVDTYKASQEESEILTYVKKRKEQLQAFRKQSKVEELWKQADEEYIPHELDFSKGKKRFEQDQDNGARSRMVPIGDNDEAWRANNSAPTLLVKIQTALSLIIDNDPQAILSPLFSRFDKTTTLANALWKRNWNISGSKENLKKFMFNLFKYGWAAGRSYPKVIKYPKKVLVSVDAEDPSKNVYEEKEIVWYNDVAKDNLNPYRTWIDENTKPYDIYSMNDCYFELDYSYDTAALEFGIYENWKFVPQNAKVSYDEEPNKDTEEVNDRKDTVTIGFYQNRAKDLFVITVPSAEIMLHSCPLPNDDGYLDVWHTLLLFKSATDPMGISLWQILMQDKAMYDKWDNMTSDQLALSIMKFGMYTGTASVIGDGVMKIKPGEAHQMINGKVDWMEIPGPGEDAYKGLKMLENRMDSNTGISPTLEGDLTGKTLGEIQLARESSLKRLKTPLENIAYAIEWDLYLTLSWTEQILSTPEIKEFADVEEMMEYEKENDTESGGLNTNEDGSLVASYYPEVSLALEKRDGVLYEAKEERFFRIGKDIGTKDLKWRGMAKVIPASLVGNSEIINQQTKMQMFNLLVPLFQMPPELAKKPAIQILRVNQEKPEDWLPDAWLTEELGLPEEEKTEPLFVDTNGNPVEDGGQNGGGAPNNGETLKGKGGIAPNGLQTVVPKGEAPGMQMKEVTGGVGQFINKMFK